MLLPAVATHACQVALKSEAFMHLKAFSPEVRVKCDSSAIKGSGRFGSFLRAQFQAFASYAGRGRNNPPAVLHSASAGDLVVNVFAPRIDVLCGHRSHD